MTALYTPAELSTVYQQHTNAVKNITLAEVKIMRLLVLAFALYGLKIHRML